ncbi:MAG TPA: PAS domain-containing protein [Kiloniellaceae bacterium]
MHVRRFRRDAPPACFGGLAPMVAVWQGKCRNDALPRWKDFAIEDFVGWHRYVALSDLEPDGDPRFRIFGSGVAEILGGDLTGKRLSEGFPAAAQDGVLAHISAVRDERLIGLLTSNVAKPGHEHRCITVVELPLQNVSGAVCQILHVCFSAPAGDG